VEKHITDEAFLKATGKSREDWFGLLDGAGGPQLDHRSMVAALRDKGGLASAWWQQEVAVAYEKARGKLAPGETAGEGFQIGVSRILDIAPVKAWRLMTEEPGRSVWLGKMEKMPRQGESYETDDGTKGKVASFTEGRHVRLTWQPRGWHKPTTLQFYVLPGGEKTSFRFHQERLATAAQREEMRTHWQGVLDKLEKMVHDQKIPNTGI
jgi:uncharacterized protein YndB with AHSA1/START domain